jgi:spoIIIJ-associated protein
MSRTDLVQQLFTHLTFPAAVVTVDETADAASITVEVDPADSGVLIGYHGETIDALQLVVSLMYNHDSEEYLPVEVDVNGYRASREKSLHELAEKAAENAVQSGREIILPPLNGRERRVIHLYLSNRADVTTYSEGDGTSRRLVVRPQEV